MTALVTALYRCLLRLLPRAFRDRFGHELVEGFSQGLRRRRTRMARARYAAAAAVDLPRTIGGEWWRLVRRRAPSPPDPPRRGALDVLRQDVRDAIRSLRQRPGFVAAVVITLALGIGANTAVFTLVDAVLLRPLPIADPDRVVAIFNTTPSAAERSLYGLDGGLSYSSFRAIERAARRVTPVAGFVDVEVGVQSDRGVRQLTAGAVSGRYFDLLGVRPAAGRLIGAADDRRDPPPAVVVLSDAFWMREFDRAPAAIGRTLRLGGTPFTIVGVAPARFRGTRLSSQPELWVPIETLPSLRAGGIWIGALGQRMLGDHPLGWVMTLGRLADGASPDQAALELDRLIAGSGETPPPAIPGVAPPDRRRVTVRPAVEAATLGDRRNLVRFVAVLGAVVGVTLLIACMNVANLVFVRSAGRAHELALRAALGAGRLRLAWMLFVEHLLLALLAAAGATAVGAATLRLLSAFMLPGEIALEGVGLDLDSRVLGITLALALVTAVLSGLWPALRAATPSSQVLLRVRGAGRRRLPPGLLVAGQVALTLMLLVGAALFVRSLRAGLTTDFGFDASRLAAVSMDLFRYGYDSARARLYYADAVAGAASLPGVTGVALTTHVPLTPLGTLPFDTADGPYTVEQPLSAGNARVTAAYFEVLGMPIVSGRTFDDGDLRGSVIPAILNESAARALFGEASPLGREFRMFGRRESRVVGVVRDANVAGARDRGAPVVYQPLLREIPTGGVSLIVRSDAPAAALGSARQLLLGIDPGVAVHDERLMADLVDRALMPQRLGSLLLSLFAGIALAVAAVGIYSVVAFTVSQRTAELGIRIALGAQRMDVLRVVLVRSVTAVAAGAAIGAAAAVPASGALSRFLYEVAPLDGPSFAAAGTLLVTAGLAATIVPVRRALQTDPVIALRRE